MKKILIIEDEAPLAEAVKYTLGREGFQVEIEEDGAAGLRRFQQDRVDLVILDLMLPTMDGFEVCRRIRSQSPVPILMLTAKDSDIDEVLGLELGADDYVTKPFNMHNLIARIKAVMRRADLEGERSSSRMEWGDISMDLDTHEVLARGTEAHLTPYEFRILEVLMRRPRRVFSREHILNQVSEGGFYGSPKTLDVHIRHLREKIEEDPANPRYIRTVRGAGYRLDNPSEA